MILRLVERLFGTVIHRDERRLVALLMLDLFVLLAVYYILKVVRDPLILMEGGIVRRNAARGVQAFVLLLAVPAYGMLANRFQPRKLVLGVFAFFLATLLAFPALANLGVPVGFAFFVWLGIFSITVVAQFWSLANDLFTEEAGKRLFAVIAAGGTVGAIVGAQTVAVLDRWLGPMELISIAAGLLALCLWLTNVVRRRGEAHAPITPETTAKIEGNARGGFTLLLQDRYLLLIALAVLLLNMVNTTGDQVMAMIVQRDAVQILDETERARFLTTYYANFQTWVSSVTAAMQVLLVARVVRLVGVRFAVTILPLIALLGYSALAALPILMLVRVLKVIENSADYSLQNTLQQTLFLPTSRAAKYKGKAAIDTFVVRFGDLASWAAVTVALAAGWDERVLAIVNLSVATVWIGVALLLGRAHRRLTSEPERTTQREHGPGTAALTPVPASPRGSSA
jgi:AAA family ATP:ADP antiporter